MSPAIENFRSPGELSIGWSQPAGQHSMLRVTSVRNGAAVIVSVGGEVDGSNEDAWSNLLTKMAAAAIPPGPFVVDVHNLHFLGCGATAALAREARRCRRRGLSLCLVGCQPVVTRTVAVCGLRPLLSIHPTLEAALAVTAAEPCRP